MYESSAESSAERDERFWSHVQVTDGCWEYTGFRDQQGYGKLMRKGRGNLFAHRYAYEQSFGPPTGVVRHTCDNPPCCRPDHLLDGTQADNIKDRQDRGRHRPGRLAGEQHSQAKLTQVQVDELRSRTPYRGYVKPWCEEFGITPATLHRILSYRGWTKAA